jgi:OOP family OmpA-OmpF porin
LGADLNSLVDSTPLSFEPGTAQLTAESALVLDEAAIFITNSPGLAVIVAGSVGQDDAAANEVLALGRAEAIVAALVDRNVPDARLIATPYGEVWFEVIP